MSLKAHLEHQLEDCSLSLEASQIEDLRVYAGMLQESPHKSSATWNSDAEGVSMHFRDAFLSMPSRESGKLLDIGTGAGLPGIPYTICLPGIQTTLLDATRKRVIWLDAVLEKLSIQGRVHTLQGRAETLGKDLDHRERYDLVTARALARLEVFLELAAPFIRVGGVLHALRGDKDIQMLSNCQGVWEMLGLQMKDKKSYQLKKGDPPRWVVSFEKVSETPGKYPRKPHQI